jgi:hypothetical protein
MASSHPSVDTSGMVLLSDTLTTSFDDSRKGVTRRPATVNELEANLMGHKVRVNHQIREDQCLPSVPNYAFPTKGAAKGCFERALLALVRQKPVFIWGGPGTGKDAVVHAYCSMTRTPSLVFTFTRGTNVKGWFYSRSIGKEGTGWEYGALWNALVHGIEGRDGKRYPALILFSDVDRGDDDQLEEFRLVLDTTSKRIVGPDGSTSKIMEGTQFAFTANSNGNGAEGMSSRPIDASLIDRMGRFVEFTALHWDDEGKVLREKFSLLNERCPDIFDQLGASVAGLRSLIKDGRLFAEISHRGLCEILSECEDLVWSANGKVPTNVLRHGFKAWLDRLDHDNQMIAKTEINAQLKGGTFSDEAAV